MAIWFGLLLVSSEGPKSHSVVSWLQAILITVAIIAAIDVWFSRRMGLTVAERGITLHYAFHRKRMPWAKVQGFEWKRWNSPRTEWIWITHGNGRAIRIPTIQRTPGGGIRSGIAYRLLASENLRLKGGAEVDAMATLERARATMQHEASGADDLADIEPSQRPVLVEDRSGGGAAPRHDGHRSPPP